jgi:hypothetical protein
MLHVHAALEPVPLNSVVFPVSVPYLAAAPEAHDPSVASQQRLSPSSRSLPDLVDRSATGQRFPTKLGFVPLHLSSVLDPGFYVLPCWPDTLSDGYWSGCANMALAHEHRRTALTAHPQVSWASWGCVVGVA